MVRHQKGLSMSSSKFDVARFHAAASHKRMAASATSSLARTTSGKQRLDIPDLLHQRFLCEYYQCLALSCPVEAAMTALACGMAHDDDGAPCVILGKLVRHA
jgi:hypothetical protein